MRQTLRASEHPPVHLHLDRGQAVPHPRDFASARDLRPGPDSFAFYALAEPCSETAVPLTPSLLHDALRQLVHRPASVTQTLGRVLQDAHERLRREHAAGTAQDPPALGLALAAVRAGEVYVALAGPVVAIVRNGLHLELLSALTVRDFRSGALGEAREPRTRVFRRLLGPGEPVLLAHSPLRQAAPLEALRLAFDGPPEAIVAEIVHRVRDLPRFSAVVITGPAFVAGTTAQSAPPPAPRPARAPSTPPSDLPSGSGGGVSIPLEFVRRTGAVNGAVPSRRRNAVAELEAPPPAARPEPRQFRPLGLELRPPRRHSSRRTRFITVPTGAVLGGLAVVLAALLAVGVWYSGAQTSAGRDARAAALIDEAVSLRERALTAPTRDQTRQLLVQAQQLLGEAAALRGNDARVVELRQTITGDLTNLDAATILPEPASVLDLRLAPGSAVQLRGLTAGAGALLAVERSTNRVFRVGLPADEQRAQTPPVLGEGRVRVPADLRQLVWMPRGGLWPRDSLLALDGAAGLWEYRGWPTPAPVEEWVRVPLRGASELGAVAAAAGFGGNFYVLDPAASQVWRYVPTDAGFDSERQGVLVAGADIRDAVDFAIDGDLYVLTRAGKLLKFSGGRLQPFPMDGLDKPLASPAAVATGPDLRSIYVADTGNNRIVVFDKGGRMQRQILLSDRLPPVADVLADEAGRTLYLLTDRQAVAAALPIE